MSRAPGDRRCRDGGERGRGRSRSPDRDCPLCPRLTDYRAANRAAHPDWHNAPVPSFGELDGRLLVVGLAPGCAERTAPDDRSLAISPGFCCTAACRGSGSRVGVRGRRRKMGCGRCPAASPTRSVACRRGICPTPPRSTPATRSWPPNSRRCRICARCSRWDWWRIRRCCGRRGLRASHVVFQHGAIHALPDGLLLADSYHVSRLNTNTGRLTEAMFHAAVAAIVARMG